MGKDGNISFRGKARISTGSSIRADKGEIQIGNNFSCNKNCFISSNRKVFIGDNVLLGWNITIIDNDGHYIFEKNERKENTEPVIIGDHVWIASNVDILKGSKISNRSVVGFRSLVLDQFEESNVLLLGTPARIVKQNISWEI